MAERDSRGFETLAPLFMEVSISLCTIAAGLAAFRLYSTFQRRGWLGMEDGMVASSLVFLIAITAIGCEACHYGFGYHTADLVKIGGDRAKALLFFWLFQIFYKVAICMNKLYFLALYLRIFPQRTVRNICWITMAVIVSGTLAFALATVLQCLPVSKYWNKNEHGHCLANVPFRWSWAAFNTVTDLWVVAIPMPIISRLQMSILKRVGAAVMFALGLFIVFISAFRMKALVGSIAATDVMWDSAPAFIWSHVEAAVGLIATCLPALKLPIQKLLPKKIVGTAGSSTDRRRQYRMHSYPDRVIDGSTGSTTEHKPRNSVFVSKQFTTEEVEERESLERILARDPGIMVTRDVTVQSVRAECILGPEDRLPDLRF